MIYNKEIELLKNNIKKIYNESQSLMVTSELKAKQDIVTSTDLFIEKAIIKLIKSSFPNDHFHTEEYNNQTKMMDRTWLIDPIDGTSNYASHLDLYCIQIALYDQDDIVLSYVYIPAFNKEYYAIKGQGAYLNDALYKINDHISKTFMVSMVGISHKNQDKTYYHKIIDLSIKNQFKLRMLGSVGLEMAMASEGIFDIFYTNVTNKWDLYPGLLLEKEAGAILLNEKGEDYHLDDLNLFVCKNIEAKNIIQSIFK